VRELLKYPSVKHIRLVDLDHEMTDLFREHAMLSTLNLHSLKDPRVTVINSDAFRWLQENKTTADVVIIDFPDPSNFALGKLYSLTFYDALRPLLKPDSLFVVQSTSPLFARRAFWCVVNTIEGAGFTTVPYHAYVPSFGEWGFVLGSPSAIPNLRPDGPRDLKFFSAATAAQMLQFPADMSRTYGDGVNRLNNQNLVRIFEEEWQRYVGKF
jgi:spermidine synthase